MNIRDINIGAGRLEQSRPLDDTEKLGSAANPESQPAPSGSGNDELSISEAGRAEAANAERLQELTFARKAMLSIPPLSEERAADILRRITEGYYTKPEIANEVADLVTSELLSEPSIRQ